jgi:DNA invertase Pin-like site-specific DNA recombinase
LQHLQKLSAYGVGWRSLQESYLDSCGPFKDVVIALMATLAKQERLRISERTKAGLQRARRQGKVLGALADCGRCGAAEAVARGRVELAADRKAGVAHLNQRGALAA